LKLGVRVTFEQWALLHRSILPHQRLLEDAGLGFGLFYGEQDYRIWYLESRVIHDVEAVINRLCSLSELSIRWPALLEAAASLLDGCGSHRRAEALVRLSQLGLDCGAEKTALRLAYESLRYYKALTPELDCRARRVMGEALLQLGQLENGTTCMQDAIAIGSRGEAWEEAASAAYALGLHAVDCDDFPAAERYYRQALELLPQEPSETLGKVHSALAIALFRQGKNDEANAHLERSLEMRKVSASSATTALSRHRALVSYMQSARKPHNGWSS
jgi:tetratricopeptide (TPR) repeat protein